jgi:hypothetical protein
MSVKTKVKSPAKDRLSPGELDGLVLAHLRKRKDYGPRTASAVSKGIDRSGGAVSNCLARLVKAGEVRQARKSPRVFVIAGKKR